MKLSERTPSSELHDTCPICGSEEVDVSNDWLTSEMKTLAVFEKCWVCGWKRLVPKTEPLFSPTGTYEDSPYSVIKHRVSSPQNSKGERT